MSSHRGDVTRKFLLHQFLKEQSKLEFGSATDRLSQAVRAHFDRTVKQLFGRFTLPARWTTLEVAGGIRFKEETIVLLFTLADYHHDLWYRINEDFSITITPPEDPPPVLPCYPLREEFRKYLFECFQSNPIHIMIPPIVYTVMDDKMSSRTLDPSKLRVDDCLAVLKHRSEKLHTNDRRAQLLKSSYPIPTGSKQFSLQILRQKIEEDNRLLEFRYSHGLVTPPPGVENEEGQQEFLWNQFFQLEEQRMTEHSFEIKIFLPPHQIIPPLPVGNKRSRPYWAKCTIAQMDNEVKQRKIQFARKPARKVEWVDLLVDYFNGN